MTLDNQFRASMIRGFAQRLVGPCNDYQIMLVAASKKIIVKMTGVLEDLSEDDSIKLYDWLSREK